jgi:hypothetical protein
MQNVHDADTEASHPTPLRAAPRDRPAAEADRAQQLRLLAALGAWDRALRRDDCSAWCVSGKTGSIHTWGDGETWAVFVACRSKLHWTMTKRRLAFCTVTQDCDDEGCLRLHQLPTSDQAADIRDVLGIQKRREVSAETLERLKAFAFASGPRSEASK